MRIWKHVSAYLIFGVLTTVVNLAVYKGLLLWGVYYRMAAVLAFVAAVSFAYVTNRKYVFYSEGAVFKESMRFLLARLATFGVNFVGLVALVEIAQADEFWSQVVMNVIVIVLNYILSRMLVFKKLAIFDKEERRLRRD